MKPFILYGKDNLKVEDVIKTLQTLAKIWNAQIQGKPFDMEIDGNKFHWYAIVRESKDLGLLYMDYTTQVFILHMDDSYDTNRVMATFKKMGFKPQVLSHSASTITANNVLKYVTIDSIGTCKICEAKETHLDNGYCRDCQEKRSKLKMRRQQ